MARKQKRAVAGTIAAPPKPPHPKTVTPRVTPRVTERVTPERVPDDGHIQPRPREWNPPLPRRRRAT